MGTVSSPTSFDLKQNFAAVTYSRRITQNLGIGISLIGAWQSLSIKGLEAFGTLGYSEYPNKLTNNDVDNSFGFGGKLGIQWNISEKVQNRFEF
jgi:long-subunit fatty acid transport protein